MCGVAPAEVESIAAVAAAAARMTKHASTSCQRRGRNRLRVGPSLTSASAMGLGGAVEGEHLLPAEPFPQWMLTHEQVQLP